METTRRLVAGFGINDADYIVSPSEDGDRVLCPFYVIWRMMLTRCYSSKWHARWPHYTNCVACPEWRSFMAFRSWMMSQDWERKELDKDLVGDGTLYSPETCCFVPQWLNVLFTDHRRARGPYPIGVTKSRGRFLAQVNIDGRRKHLGYFGTPEEAAYVYRTAKHNYVKQKMEGYPDKRIAEAVLRNLKTAA